MFKKLVGLLTVAVTGLFFVGTASADIAGSAHDLQSALFGTAADGEVCVVCHAPHDNSNANGDLLWNHTATSTTFLPYDSPSLDGASTGPGATSVLCLGCHDGTVAVDSYGGATGSLNIDGAGGNFGDVAAFGADMGNDHPIGIAYSPGTGAGQDAELNPVTDVVTFGVGTGTIDTMLFTSVVECASCHDVHNTASAGNNSLLVISNDGSGLCTTCHNK